MLALLYYPYDIIIDSDVKYLQSVWLKKNPCVNY